MLLTYKILAYTIAVLVGVQAASHAWASAGLGQFVMGGGVVDKALMESEGLPPFPEVMGFMIHGINGMMVIPLVAIIMLVVSFFTRVKGSLLWAAIVLALVALQVTLGFAGHGLPMLGALHGLNAIVLAGAAILAARALRPTRAGATPPASTVEGMATV